MRIAACLVLVACHDPPHAAPAAAPPAAAPPAAAPGSDLPAGWVRITPDAARITCANWSRDEWRVAPSGDVVAITKSTEREPNTGPTLPFPLPTGEDYRGRRHVLAVSDGFLVGLDAGEWGGGLHWFASDGTKHAKLGDGNVHGVIALDADHVLSLEGLNHLGIHEGNARWLTHAATWTSTELVPLDAGPQTYAVAPDAIYVVTAQGLSRVARDHQVTAIQPLQAAGMYPDSMTVDAQGRLWLGMRHFVLRLVPHGKTYDQDWLVPATCTKAHADHDKLDCVCDP